MMVSAAERAAQIHAPRAAGVGQEPNPTVSAVAHTPSEVGGRRHNSVQSRLVLPNKGGGLSVQVPIRTSRKKPAYPNDKKARLSVRMEILSFRSSFLPPKPDFFELRGKDEDFFMPCRSDACANRASPRPRQQTPPPPQALRPTACTTGKRQTQPRRSPPWSPSPSPDQATTDSPADHVRRDHAPINPIGNALSLKAMLGKEIPRVPSSLRLLSFQVVGQFS